MRTFIAFELPTHIRQHASGLQDRLKALNLRLRWVPPDNIHLTLKFLGDIEASASAQVIEAMQTVASGFIPLQLTMQGMGLFPSPKRPRVLWAGLGGQIEHLLQLQAQLDDGLHSVGFAKEYRLFKAHLTLARIKQNRISPKDLVQSIQHAGQYTPQHFIAAQLVFFQSDLQPQGAVYTPLARIDLSGQ